MTAYRITYRMEIFIEAKDEEQLKNFWENADLLEGKFVELSSMEEYETGKNICLCK